MSAVRRFLEETDHTVLYAAGIAFALHFLFLILFRAAPQTRKIDCVAPPSTGCIAVRGQGEVYAGTDARLVWSPMLFSFPTKMGFSRELMQEELQAPLLFEQQREAEIFLSEANGTSGEKEAVSTERLILTASRRIAPPLPASPFPPSVDVPAAQRVYMASELRERLQGGVELPAELNQSVQMPWQARADITVSEEGRVRHVLLDSPLPSPELNLAVLQTIQRLDFSPAAEAVQGTIEIYSPSTEVEGGGEQ